MVVAGTFEDRPVRYAHALSPREREVIGLLAEGLNGQQIAKRLFISRETVRTHVRNAMCKLSAKTRAQAVATAMRDREIS